MALPVTSSEQFTVLCRFVVVERCQQLRLTITTSKTTKICTDFVIRESTFVFSSSTEISLKSVSYLVCRGRYLSTTKIERRNKTFDPAALESSDRKMAQSMFHSKHVIAKPSNPERQRAATISTHQELAGKEKSRSTSFSNPLQQMAHFIQRKVSQSNDEKQLLETAKK